MALSGRGLFLFWSEKSNGVAGKSLNLFQSFSHDVGVAVGVGWPVGDATEYLNRVGTLFGLTGFHFCLVAGVLVLGTGNEFVVAVRSVVGWSDLRLWVTPLDRAARTPRMLVEWSEIGS
jgi:hypothetical protein